MTISLSRYAHIEPGAQEYLRRKFAELGLSTEVSMIGRAPETPPLPRLVTTDAPAIRQSETVQWRPGATPATLWLMTFRADGTMHMQIELPAEEAPEWIAWLERYTTRRDKTHTRPALVR